MKRFLYLCVGSLLSVFVKAILRKQDPKIVAVTGSVGKTSTTQAIVRVLSESFRVRGPIKNYNTELGVPLTILGMESPGKNVMGWIRVFVRAFRWSVTNVEGPEVIVLELGADRPGEIRRLASMVRPHIGVVTAIGQYVPVHREFFQNTDQLIAEKRELVLQIRDEGLAVLNADDERVYAMRNSRRIRIVSCGIENSESQLRAMDLSMKISPNTKDVQEHPEYLKPVVSMRFKIHGSGNVVPFELPGAVSETRVLAALQAAAVGMELGMNLVTVSKGLSKFYGPPGRLQILSGIKRTVLIDDSYNASPASVHEALEVLKNFDLKSSLGIPCRRIACLGTMAELGAPSRKEHRLVGEHAAQLCDVLMTVGDAAKAIADSAVAAGMSRDRVFSFSTSEECGLFLQERMKPGDVILVKGSQSTRMERVVKEVMAEPERASDLLVRQGIFWEKH